MNKKGFTLVELLAVIVILAIIALIATPIVINVINQAQEGADARSVEAYAKAIETKYYINKVNGVENADIKTTTITTADYNGDKVECAENNSTEDKVKLSKCTVNGRGDYTYENGKATNNK